MSGDTADCDHDQGDDRAWTPEQWEAWRANNRRLLDEGWSIGTEFRTDGSVREYAEKDGVRIGRQPKFDQDAGGNYIYGAPG